MVTSLAIWDEVAGVPVKTNKYSGEGAVGDKKHIMERVSD